MGSRLGDTYYDRHPEARAEAEARWDQRLAAMPAGKAKEKAVAERKKLNDWLGTTRAAQARRSR